MGDADLAATDMRQITLQQKGGLATRRRILQPAAVADLQTHKLTWQIPFGMFNLDEYFPLPFLNQNLEIILEFVEPALCMVVPELDAGVAGPVAQGATTNKLGYSITRARFNARMVDPSGQVTEKHRALWKADGLLYRYMDVRNYENQMAAQGTQFNFTFQTNIKSVQSVLSVTVNQATQNASGNNADTQDVDSQANFTKLNMDHYSYRIGGKRYPDYGDVDVDDVAAGEALKQYQLAIGRLSEPGGRAKSSVESWEWADVRSQRFISAALFAKEHGVYNTGEDASNNYIELELQYNGFVAATGTSAVIGVDQAQTLQTYVLHDKVLKISEKDGIRTFF